MTNADGGARPVPAGRTPGKYIVIGLGAFLALFMGVALVLSVRLEPAADRFHNPPPATPKQKG